MDIPLHVPIMCHFISYFKEKGTPPEPSWSVLRENFMRGSHFKDWDKDAESNSNAEHESSSDSV